tara:strand:+ start:196534 stop:197574 length:1041 start_codon:yes stop_codon:yes gene_type:complete
MSIKNLIRPTIKNIKAYSSARDEFTDFDKEMVFLDANENPFNNGVNRYPDPQQQKVKQLLAEIKKVSTNNILLGNGSDEVLDLIFRAFCEPKEDNSIILPPTYGMYKVLADLNGVETITVNLTKTFQPKVQAILNAATKHSKLLFLCSPNNPTANSFQSKQIEQLIREFKGIVVIDEAYIDFSEQESWLSRLNEFPNLIVTQTLSKAYGMAGIRLGICYASQEIIAVLNKIKPPYNVNALTQQFALERLGNFNIVSEEIAKIIEQRNLVSNELKAINFISRIYESDANFILVKVDDANKRYRQLLAKGIVIRNRTTQVLCKNTLRFTVGTELENQLLIKALKELES